MSGSPGRETNASTLGSCPDCDTAIPDTCLLIRYETAEGWPKQFAECPECLDVVHPR